MGLFSHKSNNNAKENTYEVNGYVIGVESHVVYHVPKIELGSTYILPDGITKLSETAIFEMRNSKPQQLIIPGSFKKFNVDFVNFENLKGIILQDGVEEVKCSFGLNKNAVDIKLPATIKKIGRNNYPIVQHLTLPNGVTEIETLFASHDTYLLSVNIPGSLKKIPAGAFNQCKNLQSVILNEGVQTSTRDIFRGTNNLQNLDIPSTYNGTIDFTTEARSGSNARGNSKYEPVKYAEEQNNILKIRITRGAKKFEFDIRRGDSPTIIINQNNIQIRSNNQPQIVNVDCNVLEQGIYKIQNGTIIKQQVSVQQKLYVQKESVVSSDSSKMDEIQEKLDIIFQKLYKEHIIVLPEFKELSFENKMKVKKFIRQNFEQIFATSGKINSNSDAFYYMFEKALKAIKMEDTMPKQEDTDGKKR